MDINFLLEERLHRESGPREGDDRSPFEKDRDIVLYSSAFKRLLSVTQVASASAGYLFHTRLTHSLQVAQVGRRLAEKLLKKQPALAESLGGINPNVVETACLAHDIAQKEIAILKQLTWFYVIDAPSLAMQHKAQTKIISRLTDVFLEAALERNPSGVLPVYYRDLLNRPEMSKEDKSRAAIDLIASMTESQATAVYQRIEGISLSSGLDKILV